MNKNLILVISVITVGCVLSSCTKDEKYLEKDNFTEGTPYITKVLDYRPAPGQFVNVMPEYEDGDTQESINKKVLDAIGNNNRGMITLGGYGGYVIVGFDHTIENKSDVCDFRVLGNAFAANTSTSRGGDGSCEAGVIMVAYDKNKNGKPDADEWFEIAGSANTQTENWYEEAKNAGNDVNIYKNYEMTYYRPESDSENFTETIEKYIRWEANQGIVKEGYKVKNIYHKQSYYPMWISDAKLTFSGTCLPQNGINKNKEGSDFFVLHKFSYGYADNATNDSDDSKIDIDWAVDKDGNSVKLPGVDFIKIYTGINQENGWIGECSTEVMGIEDLHLIRE
ncbi:MAG: PKD domain-containing protein [Phocaeicola sp.]|nr:PKD domain-containing protein [Phocaeicola sp.]